MLRCYRLLSTLIRPPSMIKWVNYLCRAEFIRPTAAITIGGKDVTMSYDVLHGHQRWLIQPKQWPNEFDPTVLLRDVMR